MSLQSMYGAWRSTSFSVCKEGWRCMDRKNWTQQTAQPPHPTINQAGDTFLHGWILWGLSLRAFLDREYSEWIEQASDLDTMRVVLAVLFAKHTHHTSVSSGHTWSCCYLILFASNWCVIVFASHCVRVSLCSCLIVCVYVCPLWHSCQVNRAWAWVIPSVRNKFNLNNKSSILTEK